MSAGVIATNRLRRRDRLCSLSNNSTGRPDHDPARRVRVLATANAPSKPAAVPIAVGDGGRCGGQNSSSSSTLREALEEIDATE